MSSELYKQWFIEQLEVNYELKRQVKNLTLYIENLKKLLPKKEEDKEPLPLNLSEIFDDTFYVNS